MAHIGHFILGLSIVIPILYFARDRFHYKVAAIFVMSNWIGPDVASVFGFLPIDFHYLIPFCLFAIPVALFYSYLSRFSLQKTENGRFIKIQDDGRREIKIGNAYALVIAGALLHTVTDAFTRDNLKIKFIEGIFEPRLREDILKWGTTFGLGIEELFLIGYGIMIVSVFLVLYFLRGKIKPALIFFFTLIGVVLLNVFLLGDQVFGGEKDTAVIFLALCFIFIPLMLLFYVAKDVYEHPVPNAEEKPQNRREKALRNLKIVGSISLAIAALILAIGIVGILTPSIIGSAFGFTDEAIFILGIIVATAGCLLCFASAGLFLKINYCRQILMVVYSILVILLFPLSIVLFLCQDDVKALFEKT